MFRKAKKVLDDLRSTVSNNARELEPLIARFTNVVSALSTSTVHPGLRADVYSVLSTAADLAETLALRQYSSARVNTQISRLMDVLPRIMTHASSAESTTGWGILNPSVGGLLPSIFGSEDEAGRYLSRLLSGGISGSYVVVPVRIVSETVLQPQAPTAGAITPFGAELPPGIRPAGMVGGALAPLPEDVDPAHEEEVAIANDSIPVSPSPPVVTQLDRLTQSFDALRNQKAQEAKWPKK